MACEREKRLAGYRIFVADRDRAVCSDFFDILHKEEAVAETAALPDLAAQKIIENSFDVILLDMGMVLESGGDSLGEVCREHQPDTPVILTVGDDAESIPPMDDLEIYNYLRKPIRAQEFCRMIRNAVETKTLREAKRRLMLENETYRRHLAEMARGRHNESRMSWERYRWLFTESKDAIFIVSAEGRLIDINRACMDILGYEDIELKRMHFWDFFSSPGEGISIFRMVCRKGDIRDLEANLLAADGSVRTCILAVNTLGLLKQSVREYQGIIRDITAQRQAEAALIKSEAKFRHLYYSSPVIMHSLNADGLVIDVNDRWLEEMGYGREEVVGKSIGFFLYPPGESRVVEKASAGQCWHHAEMDNQTMRLFRKDQSAIDILFNCIATTDPAGEQVSLFVGRNITKLRRAEAELRRLKAAIEQSSDSVIITDTDGVCLYANPALETITGHEAQMLLGQIPKILTPEPHDSEDYKQLWTRLRNGHGWEGNFVFNKKDGALFEEQATVFPVFDQSGKIINYVIIEKDITEKRRLETIAEAANLMKNIGFIFSGIRHEIGNPINSLITSLTVLERKLDTLPAETIRRFINGSIKETYRVQYLLKSLKNFNLFENPDVRDIHLNRFMSDFEPLIKQDFEEKGIDIVLRLSPDNPWVLMDPRAFHQVMLNLVTNAADAMEERDSPRIVIETNRQAPHVMVRIRDNGRGLPESQIPNLFTPFFTTKPQGTGLGLVIVKKLLLKMDGTITIESKKDIGTTVTVKIPEGKSHE